MKKKDKLTPDFIQIPYQLVADKTLAPIDRLVYGAVYFYSKMRGERCFATNTAIALLLCSTPKTVSRALQKLEDRRYIMRGFSDPDTKVNRVEIIPLVAMGRLNTRSSSTPNRGVTGQKDSTPNRGNTTQEGQGGYPKWGRAENVGISDDFREEVAKNKDIMSATTPSRGTPNGVSNREEIENIIENKDRELIIPAGLSEDSSSDSETIQAGKKEPSSGSLVNDAIALFLVSFPGDFIGKRTAFAKPPTREAVQALLERYSMDQIKELIRKYDSGKGDPYRPQVGTVYEFCTTKLAKVEAYVAKTGGLWAQKPISTPEQRADSDMLIKQKIEATRERQRKNREEWEKNHPTN